jgi:hypothetical protein
MEFAPVRLAFSARPVKVKLAVRLVADATTATPKNSRILVAFIKPPKTRISWSVKNQPKPSLLASNHIANTSHDICAI